MIRLNGTDVAQSAENVADLLSERGIAPRGIAVALNGQIVPRGAWMVTALRDGDVVEIVTAAAGG